MTVLLKAALLYAADGLPVFPVIPGGKEPAIRGGFYSATTNAATVKRLWRISDRNIAIPTGPASGFWVLDIDPPAGDDNIRRLEAEHSALPATRTAISPSGGRHLWFKYRTWVPSSIGKIAPNLDVISAGKYIVAVPSITAEGFYSWIGDPNTPLAVAPDWLIELARLARKKPTVIERAVAAIRPPSGISTAYGRAALEREIAAVAATPAGQRNSRLNYSAFRLFQLVAGGELDERSVEDQLIEACQRNGLVGDDGLRAVVNTIASGRNAGLQYPRSRKDAA